MRCPATEELVYGLICRGPGRTAADLAVAVFGPGARQQRVNTHCGVLCSMGLVERRGYGGAADPYRYYACTTEP